MTSAFMRSRTRAPPTTPAARPVTINTSTTEPTRSADGSGRSPHARGYVVGSPALLPDTGTGCWPSVPFASADLPYLRAKARELNAMLRSQAAATRSVYVNAYGPSLGHDACQPPAIRWVEPV